jgi:hypothetical protein
MSIFNVIGLGRLRKAEHLDAKVQNTPARNSRRADRALRCWKFRSETASSPHKNARRTQRLTQ